MAAGCRADLTWPASATDQSMLASTRVGLFLSEPRTTTREPTGLLRIGPSKMDGSSEQARSDKVKINANDSPRTAKQSANKILTK